MLSEARQEATDWIPGPTPMLSWRLASQLLFHLAPGGGFSGSSCGAEKGRTGPSSSWSLPGPCQGSRGKWVGCTQEMRSHLKGTVGAGA